MDLLQTGEQLPPVPAWTSRSKNNEQQPTATARSDRPNFGALQALFNIEPLTSSDEHGTGTVANTAEQQHQEEEEINFDAVDRETLTQFINSFDAEQFRKATRFISGKEGAFKKCALPKNETGSCSQVKASPSFSNNNSFTEDSLNRLIRELTYMSEEEELEALKMMTQHRQCSQFHFDFASLGSDQKCVSTFLLMYRAHCQRILDAIVRANFEELNTLVYHFWQKIPHHLVPVLSSPLLINLLGICDIRLYRTIIKLISVTLGQPLTEIAYTQLENFVSSLDSVLGAALHKENALLQQVKLELARHFGGIVRCLLRHSRVYHSVQGSGNGGSSAHCQAALKQLYLDWSRLDLSAVADHLVEQYVQLCCRGNGSGGLQTDHGCLKRVHQILYQHCAEFKLFLATFTDYSQLFDWFESVWQVSLQWYHSCAVSAHSRKNTTWSGLEFSRYFIVLWTCARLHIGQELSRIKAPSANLFSTLSALFDDFCVYKVKDLYFDDCISMLFSNAAQNSKPTLPQYFEPFDLMKQTASFLEEYETSTVADGTGEQPWLNSNSQQGVSRVAGRQSSSAAANVPVAVF
ncbi:regulatory factor X, 4 (influences HLA class II expression) [Tyrophagus putrescentiae]|nr:regulatory factor X, 4 (influences HLA class II expression) [Tyrophagus putrescentiae]